MARYNNRKALSRFIAHPLFPFVLMLIFMLLIHTRVFPNFGDDPHNRLRIEAAGSPIRAALDLYRGGSSRTIIESTYFTLLDSSPWIWRVLDSFVYVLAAYGINQLVNREKRRDLAFLTIGCVLMFPMLLMASAGWIGASNNYIWTAGLGLYAISPWSRVLSGKRVKAHQWLLTTPALLYAANQEQMTALLLGLLVMLNGYLLMRRKQLSSFMLWQLIIVCALFVYALTAPGNDVRELKDIKYMPDFAMRSIPERLYMVFIMTSKLLIANVNLGNSTNLVFILLCGLAALRVWTVYSDGLYRAVSLVPLVMVLALGPFSGITYQLFPSLKYIPEYESIAMPHIRRLHSYMPLVIYLSVYGTLMISIYLSMGSHESGCLAVIVFAAGICARLLMFMAATMYASGDRTATFTYFTCITTAVMILRQLLLGGNPRIKTAVISSVSILAGLSCLNLMLAL